MSKLQAALAAMVMTVSPAISALPEALVSVTYLVHNLSDRDCETKTNNAYTIVTEDVTTLNAGWYVVQGVVTNTGRINVSGDVHLILADGCELHAQSGINVQDNDGNVANGSPNCLTIYAQSTGTMMGALTVKGGDNQAGIGGDLSGSGGTITIHGGVVTATGGDYAAGIGGGNNKGSGGTITIYGGVVTATGGGYAAGIGGGLEGSGGTVAVHGGTVIANGGEWDGAGIGGGYEGGEGTFSAGTNGNAFILASSIQGKTNQENWSGVIFEGNNGSLYGRCVTLTTDATIPRGKTLTIESGCALVIDEGVTLINNGVIINNGTITNNGAFISKGQLSGTNKPCVSVRFELGEQGTRTGGGELSQSVEYCSPAVAPEFTVSDAWVFTGWDKPFSVVTNALVVTAHYGHPVRFELGEQGAYTGGGELSQIVEHGAAAVAPEITVLGGWVFTGWDKPFSIVTNVLVVKACYRYPVTVTVLSEHGTPVPSVGVRNVFSGDAFTYCVSGVETLGTTQYVSCGWIGSGSVPASGTMTNVSFTVTNDTTIAWQWTTNYWLEVVGEGIDNVSGGLATGWKMSGTNLTLRVVPESGSRFEKWIVDGVETSGILASNGVASLNVTMDAPHVVSAHISPLTLAEALDTSYLTWKTGGATNWISQFELNADGVDAAVCRLGMNNTNAWIETTVTGPGDLSFIWCTPCESGYLLLVIDGQACKRLSGETEWEPFHYRLGDGKHIVRWQCVRGREETGSMALAGVDCVSWCTDIMKELSQALDATKLVWWTSEDKEWRATTSNNVEYAISGEIGDNEISYVETTVSGPGQLSFAWMVSSEDGYDWFDFLVDGISCDMLTGEQDWTNNTFMIPAGNHTLMWKYSKDAYDDPESNFKDLAALDRVVWSQEVIINRANGGDVKIPCAWFDEQGLGWDKVESYDTVVPEITANNHPVWESYVAGLCPTNPASQFTASITISNGVPMVTWTPDLGAARRYKLSGKTNLTENGWSTPTNSAHRFFKVNVEMP